MRYLERELEKRQRLGKAAVFAGMSMGTLFAATGCNIIQPLAGMPVDAFDGTKTVLTDTIPEKPLEGDVVAVSPEPQEPDTLITEPLMGLVRMYNDVFDFSAEDYRNLMKDKFMFPEMKHLTVVSGRIEYQMVDRGDVCESLEELTKAAKEFRAPYYRGGEQKMQEDLAALLSVDASKFKGDMEVAFTLNSMGYINEVMIVKGIDKVLDDAVVAVFEKLDWYPAEYELKEAYGSQSFECRCVQKIHFPIKND